MDARIDTAIRLHRLRSTRVNHEDARVWETIGQDTISAVDDKLPVPALPAGSQHLRLISAINDAAFVQDVVASSTDNATKASVYVSVVRIAADARSQAPEFSQSVWNEIDSDSEYAELFRITVNQADDAATQDISIQMRGSSTRTFSVDESAYADECEAACGAQGTVLGLGAGLACGGLAILAGLPTAGVGGAAVLGACGVISAGSGYAYSELCSDDFGATNKLCDPSGQGTMRFQGQCELVHCSGAFVLEDEKKNLHRYPQQFNITYFMMGTNGYTQKGGPYGYWDYDLDRTNAGTLFSGATYLGQFDTRGRPMKLTHHRRECATWVVITLFFLENENWNTFSVYRTELSKPFEPCEPWY